MKKTLVMIAVLAVIVAFSVPALAYTVEWTENFEHYAHGGVVPAAFPGQDGGWLSVTGAANRGNIVHNPAGAASPNHYYQQVASTKSAVTNDFRKLNDKNSAYKEAFLEAWVWDPMYADPATKATDTRVGLVSSVHNPNVTASTSNMATANITSNGAGSTGDNTYWRVQWTWRAVSMDGTPKTGGTGFTWTQGAAAPRQAGWNKVWQYFALAPDGLSWTCDWYINPADEEPVSNLTLSVNSTCGSWAGMKDVAGVYIGSHGTSPGVPGRIDDMWFGGTTINPDAVQKPVPEPSSLLALGAGLMGVFGMIRRRK